MNARISANANAETSASAPQSSCAGIFTRTADASTNTREEETMNKKNITRSAEENGDDTENRGAHSNRSDNPIRG